ncbi:SH3 domain-containing protein [Lachnospiraceae bacterium C1.1]|nr:SH3 domain-containing protein [Lachnospiraceae bacterium C1.1]
MKLDLNEIKKFVTEHYQYVAVGVLFVLLVIVLIVFSLHRASSGEESKKDSEDATETVSTEPIPVPDDIQLEQNAYEEINSFFTKYYNALAEADFDTLADMGEVLDDDVKAKRTVRAGYTEDYENMSCYTVEGPESDSYIVFVYYEIKFKNIDTLAPGLSTFFIIKDGDSFKLKDIGSLPDNEKEYITEVASSDDVQKLLEDVDVLYQKNTEADATLAAFMTSLQTKIDAADASSIAADTASTEADESATVRVTTTDTVNVRSTPDTNGEKIGTAMAGDSFIRLSEENGWSKIQYKDTEAYILSEYLTTAQGDTVVAGQINGEDVNAEDAEAAENNEAEAEAEPEEAQEETETTDNSSSSTGKKVYVSEAISVRGGASTDSEKIGSAYNGDTYSITGEDGDWYKIDYKGSTGYVRKDVVTVK